MTVIGFVAGSPAAIILQHLQRQGHATIKELEEVLGVRTTAVREHLAHLQTAGLIAPSTVRRGAGRPHFVYTLTEKAQSLFPKHYDLLINLLLHAIVEEDGRERVEQLLDRVSRQLARDYAERVSGPDVQARMVELRALLELQGIPAEIEHSGETIRLFACPYYDVAQEHPDVCMMDQHMLERVIGTEIELEASIRQGHHTCRFAVKQRPKVDG